MQAVGDERHNHARVKVRPVSVGGDTKLAEIRAGIIAEAEYVSNAESIYDYAHEMQCRGAYGAWRVLTRYCADNPFICEELLPAWSRASTGSPSTGSFSTPPWQATNGKARATSAASTGRNRNSPRRCEPFMKALPRSLRSTRPASSTRPKSRLTRTGYPTSSTPP